MNWKKFIEGRLDGDLRIGNDYLLRLERGRYQVGTYSEYNGKIFWFNTNMHGSVVGVTHWCAIEEPKCEKCGHSISWCNCDGMKVEMSEE